MAKQTSTGGRTRRSRKSAEGGAEFRLDESPYGDTTLRREWAHKADGLATLDQALAALQEWRRQHPGVSGQDALWIEARLEERVAVLRFDALDEAEIRSRTLTGENVQEVCADYLARAEAADADTFELERINDEFRLRFKPPVMPTNDFMRTEMLLAERLMKTRTLDWYDKPLSELRADRGVVVHTAPAED